MRNLVDIKIMQMFICGSCVVELIEIHAGKGKIHCSCWMCRRKSYDDPKIRDKRAAIDTAQQLLEIE